MDSDSCASPPPPPQASKATSASRGSILLASGDLRCCSRLDRYIPPDSLQDSVRSSPSPPNSTGGTIDSDSGEPHYGDAPSAISLGQLKRGQPYSALYQWDEPGSFLLERKKPEKMRRKRKLGRREEPAPVAAAEEEYRAKLLKAEEEEEPYAAGTPTSPSSEGEAQLSADRCSAWDSDTPSNASYPPVVLKEEQGLIQTVGKRTIIRQGKQVVFRDEDGSADDEDIMVDSDDDSWDLVTCFCMKPFAGRPMIECNECHTWIHLSCAKIRKSNVPEVYICQKCRDSKFDIRRSNRSRMGSRRHFLD
ncbi:PREDICTED: PHD finger protein 13 [Gekko japonicus]|uniref:PHD finger protein 13 n=1 Tax=Gekko japonicus TaxID=146911 RepID=A0ABM1JJV4_GEKJA|nr:PREDICTED: PHD finger protein 13 [Gekko japonicus]